uniref:Uncharacterized protein n=1 Tax=Cucumis sativus TaxID=3659 RepID=A0A0A0LGH6_CUCSA
MFGSSLLSSVRSPSSIRSLFAHSLASYTRNQDRYSSGVRFPPARALGSYCGLKFDLTLRFGFHLWLHSNDTRYTFSSNIVVL